MPCYRPLEAAQAYPGAQPTIYKRGTRPALLKAPAVALELPCGSCIGCRLDTVSHWTTRCMHEAQLHQKNCALTLTYSNDPDEIAQLQEQDWARAHQDVCTTQKSKSREFSTIAPKGLKGPNIARVDNSLSKTVAVPYGAGTRGRTSMYVPEKEGLSLQDHQNFMKMYRYTVKVPVRYYMCGEYGEKLGRPHFHYVIFGHDFEDKKYFKKSLSGTKLYRSATLETIWTHGYSWIGEVDLSTCAYVAGYVMKKMKGKKAEEHYRRKDEAGNDYWLRPEFNQMSRNPGIGKTWWDKFHHDVTVDDGVYHKNQKTKAPRYYDKLLERTYPRRFATIKQARKENALKKAGDNTPARLADKEAVAIARQQLKQRQLERKK
ncbi:replication initiator protein [Microvirus D_HF4_340]|nr:replication initiator protein [Microvirus D_HF4_340]